MKYFYFYRKKMLKKKSVVYREFLVIVVLRITFWRSKVILTNACQIIRSVVYREFYADRGIEDHLLAPKGDPQHSHIKGDDGGQTSNDYCIILTLLTSLGHVM